MKRTPLRARRRSPRTRVAPRWTPDEWDLANVALGRRSGARCDCCGIPLDGRAERHHRKRRRDGGDRLSNVLLLRPACHRYWTEQPEEARRRGIIVSAYAEDPADVPVLWHGERWVLLDDEGGRHTPP